MQKNYTNDISYEKDISYESNKSSLPSESEEMITILKELFNPQSDCSVILGYRKFPSKNNIKKSKIN